MVFGIPNISLYGIIFLKYIVSLEERGHFIMSTFLGVQELGME